MKSTDGFQQNCYCGMKWKCPKNACLVVLECREFERKLKFYHGIYGNGFGKHGILLTFSLDWGSNYFLCLFVVRVVTWLLKNRRFSAAPSLPLYSHLCIFHISPNVIKICCYICSSCAFTTSWTVAMAAAAVLISIFVGYFESRGYRYVDDVIWMALCACVPMSDILF